MKLGSEAHKELFCRSFMESHLRYEPSELPWPQLDAQALEILRGIPFWTKALDTEREAGVLVTAYGNLVEDPILRDAIALQGQEESRHSRLIQTLIDRYGIEMEERPPVELPQNIEQAFTHFGFEECLDSFFAFGLFGLAREAGFFPDQIFAIFDPILDEEARHIVFFVNWFTYLQIQRGQGFVGLRATKTLWHYGMALRNLIDAVGSGETSGSGFTATNASAFTLDLTLEGFLTACLEENQRRMSKFDPELLQPQLMPRLATLAFRTLQLRPRRKPRTVESPNLS
ncbi:MAG TPA: ferritin-like domain-containing protein [Waterburya sp.]|jgi:hypothetical protein